MVVGFVGVGAMGGPMCRNIIRKSQQRVLVFDLDQRAVRACTSIGAEAASSVADLALQADVIFTSLPTPPVVLEVGLGAGGIAENARPGTVWFDLTTNSPGVVRKISEALRPKGVRMVDAPITGGVARAESGTVALMLGGDPELLEEYEALLASFASKVIHMGPVGSGAITKIINNMIVMSNIAVAAESLMLGVSAGLDPVRLVDLLQNGTADSASLRSLARHALSGDWAPSMTLDLAAKDVRLALDLADEADCQVPVALETSRLLLAAREMGLGGDDATSLLRVYEAAAGRTVHEAALRGEQSQVP